MNKKLRRLLQPNVSAFFVVLVLFCVVALVLEQYYLALAEAVVTAVLFVSYHWAARRRHQVVSQYVRSANEMVKRTAGGEVPFPEALININEDEIVWDNKAFRELTELRDRLP